MYSTPKIMDLKTHNYINRINWK